MNKRTIQVPARTHPHARIQAHAHIRIRAHPRTVYVHAQAHRQMRARTRTHTCIQAYPRTRTRACTHTRVHAHARARTRACTHTRVHAHVRARTRPHVRTHTRQIDLKLPFSKWLQCNFRNVHDKTIHLFWKRIYQKWVTTLQLQLCQVGNERKNNYVITKCINNTIWIIFSY